MHEAQFHASRLVRLVLRNRALHESVTMKRLVIGMAIVGCLIVLWEGWNRFAPIYDPHFARVVLFRMCFSCIGVLGNRGGRIIMAAFVLGPINAAIYATIGFVVATAYRLITKLSGTAKSLPKQIRLHAARLLRHA